MSSSLRRVVVIASIGAGLAGCGAQALPAHPAAVASGPRGAAPSPAGRARSFVSLWPACACGRRTRLDVFSLAAGRRLGTLATISVAPGEYVSPPAATRDGRIELTFSSGPRCAAPPGGGVSAGPCQPLPGSCSGRIVRLDRGGRVARPVLSIPASNLVSDASPSPDGRRVALLSAGCATSFFDASIVVRDLSSGRSWAIGADAPRCHSIGRPAWNAAASRLVFAYGPSILPYGTKPSASESCAASRFGRLVEVSAARPSSSRRWRLIAADKGCSFVAAAFDRRGIAAVEACQRGLRGFAVDPNLGEARLLQLSARGRVVERLSLQPGWEEGLVSSDFRDGSVLVSQDQPANAGYPERDWVWRFDGRRLRLIARYRANDAAQVIAAAW